MFSALASVCPRALRLQWLELTNTQVVGSLTDLSDLAFLQSEHFDDDDDNSEEPPEEPPELLEPEFPYALPNISASEASSPLLHPTSALNDVLMSLGARLGTNPFTSPLISPISPRYVEGPGYFPRLLEASPPLPSRLPLLLLPAPHAEPPTVGAAHASLASRATADNDAIAIVERGSSSYSCVRWESGHNKWKADVMLERTRSSCFDDEQEAAREYDEAAAPIGRSLHFPGEERQGVRQQVNANDDSGHQRSSSRKRLGAAAEYQGGSETQGLPEAVSGARAAAEAEPPTLTFDSMRAADGGAHEYNYDLSYASAEMWASNPPRGGSAGGGSAGCGTAGNRLLDRGAAGNGSSTDADTTDAGWSSLQCPPLTTLELSSCSNITDLACCDVGHCSSITDIGLVGHCSGTTLTSLDWAQGSGFLHAGLEARQRPRVQLHAGRTVGIGDDDAADSDSTTGGSDDASSSSDEDMPDLEEAGDAVADAAALTGSDGFNKFDDVLGLAVPEGPEVRWHAWGSLMHFICLALP